MVRQSFRTPAVRGVSAVLLGGGLCASIVGGLTAVPAGASPLTSPSAPAIHVDCQAPAGGTGSGSKPLNSLTAVDAATLVPGQEVLLKRGTTCSGTLEVQSSGAPGEPIVVSAYGTGASPRIVGTGPDAVLLENASDVTIEKLEITNPGTPDTARRGVHVVADGVTVQGVTLEKLSIHDVDGNLTKDSGGSGGIQLDALGTSPAGRFDGVTVTDNQIDNVSRSGIFIVGTRDSSRPPAAQPWPAGSTGIVVSHNTLDHLAGDGIVSTGTVGTVLEDNEVSDGNQAGTPYTDSDAICDAGIWAFNANSTVIQDNVVSDMEFNGCDGEGYDVDYDQDGTVVQDNISEDNGGGFILLCTDENPHDADVRYNLSIDDPTTVEDAPCDIATGNVGTLSGIRMYDNTFVGPAPSVSLETNVLSSMLLPGSFEFMDNIVDATTPQSAPFPCGDNCTNNLFWGLPASGSDAVVGDPAFKHPVVQGTKRTTMARGFQVTRGSPAIKAGVPVTDGVSRDFFGHPAATGAPTIGFFQARG